MEMVRVVSAVFWVFRSWYAVVVVMAAGPLGLVWALAELVQAYYGFRNLIVARFWDSSISAYLLVAGYSLSYLMVPTSTAEWHWSLSLLLLAVMAAKIWCIASMGDAYSSGSPNYVNLVSGGVFSLVRHPLASLGMLQRLVFLIGFPSFWNLGVFVFGVGMSCFMAYTEEKHLRAVSPLYALYMDRVPRRFVPFVTGGAP